MRRTFLREWGERDWNVDDLVHYDVPAILDYVERRDRRDRVNWIGHSLGGMLIFPYLELSPRPDASPISWGWEARSFKRKFLRPTCSRPAVDFGSYRSSRARGGWAGRWHSFAFPEWV